jgi:hypothetical protein
MNPLPVLLNLALLLAAAKAHGRQMRMERLARGHAIAGFARGVNPPWVEARWAWERRLFWGLYPALLGLCTGLLGWTWPLPLEVFSLDLSLMGLLAWGRLERDWRADPAGITGRQGAGWMGMVRRESAAWWALVAGLAAFLRVI